LAGNLDKGSQSPAKLTITNKSGAAVEVKLSGAAKYTFNAPVGKTSFQVNRGEYIYTYKTCGTEKKGKIESGGKLAIAACPMAKILIINFDTEFARVVFSGPYTYNFTLTPEVNRVSVIAGVYRVTAYTCGKTETEVVNLTKGKWIGAYGCEEEK
jgi:hypothetical protein